MRRHCWPCLWTQYDLFSRATVAEGEQVIDGRRTVQGLGADVDRCTGIATRRLSRPLRPMRHLLTCS